MTYYGTESDGTIYFSERLGSDAWTDASSTDRVKALKQSTRIIDNMKFVGLKLDEDQEHQFPRGDDETVPEDIEFATYEIAIALLDGFDPNSAVEDAVVTSEAFSDVKVTYDRSNAMIWKSVGIPNITAWNYLSKYILNPGAMKLSRVS